MTVFYLRSPLHRLLFLTLLSVTTSLAASDTTTPAAHPSPSTTNATAPYSPTNAAMLQMSADPEMAFYLQEALSLANTHGASTGEILRLATQLVPSDFESSYTAYNAMAQRVQALAESTNAQRDPVGAREAWFRAASYYRGADFLLHGNQSDPRIESVWANALNAFDKAMALMPVPGERFRAKAKGDTIGPFESIGIFFPAQQKRKDFKTPTKRLPTVVIGTGYDGSQEALYHSACVPLLARGLNCVVYEGPGQPTVLREQKVGFIPDWWNVVTPVVDHVLARDDVDPEKLVLIGVSFGGSLAPIAASKEHRFAAVVAIDGLAKLRDAIEEQVPKNLVDLYNAGAKNQQQREEFDRVMLGLAKNTSTASNFRWLIDQSLFSFHTTSPYQWFTEFGNIAFTNEMVKELKDGLPVAVFKGQNDVQTLNQPEIAYKMLTEGRKNGEKLTYYHEFETAIGAGDHCQIGNEAELARVTVNWLSDIWGGFIFQNQ